MRIIMTSTYLIEQLFQIEYFKIAGMPAGNGNGKIVHKKNRWLYTNGLLYFIFRFVRHEPGRRLSTLAIIASAISYILSSNVFFALASASLLSLSFSL